MKQKIYILGIITSLVIFTGTIFKINHFPGAGILLTAGIVTLVIVFIPVALINHYKAEETRQYFWLHIVTWLTCFVSFTAMLFKIQHWPLTNLLMLVALPFPYVIFLPVFLKASSKDKNFNIYNVVFVLSLLAFNSVFAALLSLNVSKTRIDDSYNLSRNYNNLNEAMKQLSDRNPQTNVDLKIDEVLKIVNEYQDVILKYEGISVEQWKSNPEILRRPDAKVVAEDALLKKEGVPAAARLEKGIRNLITEMENTRGYEDLAKVAPEILDISNPLNSETSWADRIFLYNNLSWALIYLDALEANLYLMKSPVIASTH